MNDDEVAKTLRDMEDQIRFRLRMKEVIPNEMAQYRIEDGRAHFTVPNLFETSISLRGAQEEDGWFFSHVEFLHKRLVTMDRIPDLNYLKYVCKCYEGALKRRREHSLKGKASTMA